MKILNAQQLRDWDAYTIKHQSITSLELMERAAQQCADWIMQRYVDEQNFEIVCGKGNNGGDGLVIARLLHLAGKTVTVFIADWNDKESADFKGNLSELQQIKADLIFLKTVDQFSGIGKAGIIIECLFGFGLNRSPDGNYASLIAHLNKLNKKIISIDVPAGMFLDKSSTGSVIIKATETLTFQTWKLCFLMADQAEYFGDVYVLPIGLSEEFISQIDLNYTLTDLPLAASFYKLRKKFSHKGTYGHALLAAGNEGKVGAAVMCATACLRSGAGLLTCSIPQNYFPIIHTTLPEAMVMPRGEEGDLSKFSVVGAGPGLGTEEETANWFHALLLQNTKPMVIDADALNIISKNKEWLKVVPKYSVLTPHPKEFDRLFGESNNDFERMEKAIQGALKNEIIIVLKGTYTLVTDGKLNFFNSTGNNGMATGGSGDILTGIITGLISQKYEPFEAAVVGVYIHGLAADLSLNEQSYESMLPMDIVERLGSAFKQLQNNKGA